MLQLDIGKRTEGRRALQAGPAWPTARTRARAITFAPRAPSRALNRIDDAQSFFRDAIGLAPTDPRVNTEWGELFLEKYNKAEAAKSFQEALKVDPRIRPGAARHGAGRSPMRTRRRRWCSRERVLKQNPNDAGAQLVLAQVAVYQDKKADVKAAIDRILEFNPKHLEALSMKAAMAYVEGRDQDYQQAVADGAEDSIRPTARCIASSARSPRTTTASTKRWSTRARRSRSIARTSARLPTSARS